MVLNLHSFSGYDHGNGALQVLDFVRESTSICAVDTFLIISGFFGIRWKFKSFFNLTFQLMFYSFAVYLAAVTIGFLPFTITDLLSCCKGLYASWGFASCYLLLYFLSPLLNAFIEKSSPGSLLGFIVALFIAENFISRGFDFINFPLMYLIGAFLKKSNATKNWQVHASKAYLLVTFIITILVFSSFKYLGVNTAEKMCGFILGYSYLGPFVILQAVFLFLIFARLNFTSNFINWCASSCFAIFLIHMHPSIKQIGYYSFTESLYEQPLFYHIGVLVLIMLGIFFGSILIDKVRICISNTIYNIIMRIASLMPEKLLSYDTYIPASLKDIL